MKFDDFLRELSEFRIESFTDSLVGITSFPGRVGCGSEKTKIAVIVVGFWVIVGHGVYGVRKLF